MYGLLFFNHTTLATLLSFILLPFPVYVETDIGSFDYDFLFT